MAGQWGDLMRESLVRPRRAARAVLALNPAPAVLAQAALAVTAGGMVLAYLAMRIAGGEVDAISAALLANPLVGAAVQLAVMGSIGWLSWRVGRMFGGNGGLFPALTLVVWLNAMMLAIQAVQLVALIVLPPLGAALALAAVVWVVWAFTNFITELHGFENPFLVFGGVLVTVTVLFFGVGLVMAVLGVGPEEAM